MQGRTSVPSGKDVLGLARCLVVISLRLDRDGPTGWECGIVHIEVIVLEGEASEDGSNCQDLAVWKVHE